MKVAPVKFLIPLLLFLCFPLSAESTGTWSCALTVFSGNLDRSDSYLYRQIPLQLYYRLSEFPDHRLSDGERQFYDEKNRGSRSDELLDSWEKLHAERDALLFSGDRTEYETLSLKIDEAQRKYEESLAPGNGDDRVLALDFLTAGNGGILFSSPEAALEKHPDYVITGSLDRAGDFILIEIRGISRAGDRDVPLWSGAVEAEKPDESTAAMTDTLKETILGRPWSALSVTAEPSHSQIFLNGQSLGVGSVQEEILEPGPAVLEVRYPRYGVYREELELRPGERINRSVVLEAGKENLITVETVPSGADVILGSVHKGVTPLILPRPLIPETLILTLDGYDTITSSLGPETPAVSEFSFTAGRVDWNEERLTRQGKFYNSLGWFSLSLAAPLVLTGIKDEQILLAQKYAALGDADRFDEARSNAILSQGLYWGGVAVSGVLLGVSITRLVQYIRASEKSIEQR
ncbi:MAG: PEGA domain-containing protein [Spirochaetales bacterium]|nr:PEGA domain-containing protein [Spirochaetales bacterium]